MKRYLLVLMCMTSFSVLASKYDTMYSQMIDEKGRSYNFETDIIVGKGETKEFTITGLYNQFYARMYCTISTQDLCPIDKISERKIKSAFIFSSNIDSKISNEQNDYYCTKTKDIFPHKHDGLVWSCGSVRGCNPDDPENLDTLLKSFFLQVANGSSFQIINRPEWELRVHCTTDFP